MTIETSLLSLYEVEGQDNDLIVSRLGLYVVEGGDRLLYSSRMTLYVVEGPPITIPPAPRRRQLIMP